MIDTKEVWRKINSTDPMDHIDLHATIMTLLPSLLNRLEAAEKELAELRSSMKFRTSLIGRTEAERDALRAAVRHEADCVEAAMAEIKPLRAKVEAMERQESARLVTPTAYRWRYRGAVKWQYGELTEETVQAAKEHNHEVQALGILPDAHPAPSVPDGWKEGVEAAARLIDQKAERYANRFGIDDVGGLSFGQGPHAEIKMDHYTSMIELADEVRAMLAARARMSVPEGWKLVPIEPTPTMVKAGLESSHALNVHRVLVCYDAMIDAAPEAKP